MTLLYLILGGGFLSLAVLVAYTVKRRAYAALGLSLGVISAFVLLSVAAYQIQMGYDHRHMTHILKSTSDAIRVGKADEVVAAYDRFTALRTNADMTFWDARNRLYDDLAKLSTKTNVIHKGAATDQR